MRSKRVPIPPQAGGIPLREPLWRYLTALWWSDTAPRNPATNRLTLSAAAVRRVYRVRPHIEQVARVCNDQRGLSGWQARSERAQWLHLTRCLVAFGVLERERQE